MIVPLIADGMVFVLLLLMLLNVDVDVGLVVVVGALFFVILWLTDIIHVLLNDVLGLVLVLL